LVLEVLPFLSFIRLDEVDHVASTSHFPGLLTSGCFRQLAGMTCREDSAGDEFHIIVQKELSQGLAPDLQSPARTDRRRERPPGTYGRGQVYFEVPANSPMHRQYRTWAQLDYPVSRGTKECTV